MAGEPGQTFVYDNGSSQLLSAVLTKATGMSALEFANQYLFGPLEISNVWWSEDENGYSLGSHGLMMLPEDMAKFGVLYLNNGVWHGEQIVRSDYIQESTQAHSEGGPPVNVPYGYQWWVLPAGETSTYFAAGYGGQFVYVVPEFDLVVVITSEHDRHYEDNASLLDRFIIPAILE